MKFVKESILFAAMLVCIQSVLADEKSSVVVPFHKDNYSNFVNKLEAGQVDIDFREFRESFLESDQYRATRINSSDLEMLRKSMHALMKDSNYSEIIVVANKMLSIDYTDIEAHKVLQQTYKILGDTANKNKHHDIEFGLLKSIVMNGDGKSCKTAWKVIQVSEEYFILNMLGAQLLRQSVEPSSGLCDKIEVKTDAGDKIYYFEISGAVKGYTGRGVN